MPWPLSAVNPDTLSPTLRAALYAPAKLYEFGVRLRIALYETAYLKPKSLTKPVISVGNITVGGTGKTPLVEYIARYLTDEGHETVILTRGYGRRSTARLVLNDGQPPPDWATAGDEPLMLARRLPDVKIIVGADRYANGRFAEATYGCDVLVLDDGFQHLQLQRDLNILVLDATDPFGDGELLPFGRLREPLYALKRADAVVVTRSDRTFDQEHLLGVLAACDVTAPVFFAYHDIVGVHELGTRRPQAQRTLVGQPIGVFSALGKPVVFEDDLANLGANVVFTKRFPDHHPYTAADIAALTAEAKAAGAERLVTTEKDAVKVEGFDFGGLPVSVVEIKTRFEDEVGLKSLLLRTIVRKKGKYYRKPSSAPPSGAASTHDRR
ncbi:MAG: tetraacyldisaccharide 4'-kinase [Chloracidobacterium sp.]|nr:tetraacyldisaccharide 4'-kinase [Chloracidobacterium sp.]MDW8217185.1 tetraacyldisaccharide 4'-kinase [Acidobacteriota bacterium]